ncbi:MAG: 3-deoxy-D-manno-octulosonic acid transferase [Blastocatellia bacterium]
MRIVYSFLLAIAFILLLPVFAWQSLVKRKYLDNLRERSGFLPGELQNDARPAILLHAVSVGEALSAAPLVRALRKQFPRHRLIISTTTAAGQAAARERIADAQGFCYFPFDWKFSVRRMLDAIRPEIVILMESELWLNFLDECRERKIPVVVANGRISDRSFRRSRKIGFLIRRLYALVTHFAMQSRVDADRAIALGAPADRVVVSGNLKYDIGDAGQSAKIAETAQLLDQLFALSSAPLVVAGSTHDGEESIIIQAFRAFQELKARPENMDVRLLIAPRHPDRFDAVARLLEDAGMDFVRRSTANGREAEVILLDTIGELAAIYQFASVVFVGGSLVPVGGHNILEPALYARPIIVGPHMHNFREITEEFLRRDALVQLSGPTTHELQAALARAWVEILTQPLVAQPLGENARRAVEENRGATARTVAIVAELIP